MNLELRIKNNYTCFNDIIFKYQNKIEINLKTNK
jgi:hypothetical protein